MSEERIREIVAKHRGTLGEVLGILHDVQRSFGCISEKSLSLVADLTGRSLVDLYGVASYHPDFRLAPAPTNGVRRAS
jgi:formate dehydrogenase subunit gamma